jgi:hypothetical protein
MTLLGEEPVFVATPAVDQHADVAVDRFNDSEAHSGPAVFQNPVDVIDRHGGAFLESC